MIDVKLNCYSPQKQSIKGIAVLFIYQLQSVIKQTWIPLLLFIYKFDFAKNPISFLIIFLVILAFLVISYLKFINFTFYIDSNSQEFTIKEGIFNKTKTTIPLQKIQQVNINQSFLHKLVNVYSLDIDTAGSSEKEVNIKAIDYQLALNFKEKLIAIDENQKFINTIEEETIFKTNFSTLLKVALTSHYGKSIAILLGFLFTIYNGFKDVKQSFEDETKIINEDLIQETLINSVGFIIILVVFIVFLINIVSVFLKYFNLKIQSKQNILTVSSGIFASKNKLLKPSKVQEIQYSQNYFQKKLNFFNLKVKQANNGNPDKETIENQVTIPGCNSEELSQILRLLFETSPQFSLLFTPKKQFFVAVLINLILFPVLIFYSIAFWFSEVIQYQYVIIIYVILILVFNYFKFKNSQLHFDGNFIIKKHGAWDISNQIIETYKIQGIELQQKIWHQKKDIGDLILFSATGQLRFRFATYSKLENYVNYWLYQIETEPKNWM